MTVCERTLLFRPFGLIRRSTHFPTVVEKRSTCVRILFGYTNPSLKDCLRLFFRADFLLTLGLRGPLNELTE